jgi:FtsZ-binding cell division protein ZapB
MEPTDLTIEILQGIREEIQTTNKQLDEFRTEVRSELGQLRDQQAATEERLATELGQVRDRQTSTEVRLATELVGVAGAVREVRDLLREDRALRGRVDDHERRISAIEGRTG